MQSGCCKPPTSCNYNAAMERQEADCFKWNNALPFLCYECDSCKAGVLEDVRKDWHKLSVLNVVILVFLICIYSIGCCAFRNSKRSETDYPYGENRMSKVRPRWDYYWYNYSIMLPFSPLDLLLVSTYYLVHLPHYSFLTGLVSCRWRWWHDRREQLY